MITETHSSSDSWICTEYSMPRKNTKWNWFKH